MISTQPTDAGPRRNLRRARRVGAAAIAAVGLAMVGAQTANAALPPPGSIVSSSASSVVFVNAAAGTACAGEVSSGSFIKVGGTKYGAAASSRVGDRFPVTIVASNVSTCQSGSGIALQLPAGVTLSRTGPGATVTCKRHDPTSTTSPVNETVFTSPTCPQFPSLVNGQLILNPPNSVGWLTRPNSNPAQSQIEVRVWFRADTAGQKTFTARVCDLQGPLCSSNPPRNVSAAISTSIT